jgi:D-alanyl-lipoteichoic acid acyltransferase DltB (MBOAT superfamily)
VDVYRNRIQPVKSFGELLLFTSYFPQLVAGPIERAEVLLPRLRNIRPGNREQILRGLFLTGQGLLKKIVIADHLSEYVDIALLPVMPAPDYGYTFTGMIFALQIYADFSGYTDIARGISLLFGVPLTENFRLPFFASNPSEIWRRWHITLMAFLRDYLYIPLGGAAAGPVRKLTNVFIVFAIGGLWHGAGIGYILWGLYSGLWVIGYYLTRPLIDILQRLGIPSILLKGGGVILTFLSFSWGTLIIRSNSLDEIIKIFTNLFPVDGNFPFPPSIWQILFFAWPLIYIDLIRLIRNKEELYDCYGTRTRAALSAAGLAMILTLGSFGGERFFYFQF